MKGNSVIIVIVSLFFLVSFSAGYIYLLLVRPPVMPETVIEQGPSRDSSVSDEEYISIRVYFPHEMKLRVEQRNILRVFSQKKILKGAIGEFLRGPADPARNVLPPDTVLLGVFIGNDGVAYINFSEDFRRNFHGDVVDEFLLLRGLYETVISNIRIDDVGILIEHKEVDTIGGHFYTDRPLKQLVTQEIKFDS